MLPRITLFRNVNHRTRYYHISVHPTLFNTYVLERIYGSVTNRRPTRIIEEHFEELVSAIDAFEVHKGKRKHRGYFENFVHGYY